LRVVVIHKSIVANSMGRGSALARESLAKSRWRCWLPSFRALARSHPLALQNKKATEVAFC
jgi:hypothetical protein